MVLLKEEVWSLMKADIGLIGLAVMGENLAINNGKQGFFGSCISRLTGVSKGIVERCGG